MPKTRSDKYMKWRVNNKILWTHKLTYKREKQRVTKILVILSGVCWCLFGVAAYLGAVWATSWRKTPKLVLTGCFSVSAQTSLKRYSERLLLFELSSSLSRIDDVFVNFREKKVTTRTLHWDAKTSFHLHTVAYDHARTVFLRRRHLELCRSVDCALAPRFLAPVHVYIHFQAYWACLVVIETNEKHV